MLQCVVITVVTAAGGVYVMHELQHTLMLVDIRPLASASLQLGECSLQSRSRCDQLCICCKTHVCTVVCNKLICRTACKYAVEGIALQASRRPTLLTKQLQYYVRQAGTFTL